MSPISPFWEDLLVPFRSAPRLTTGWTGHDSHLLDTAALASET